MNALELVGKKIGDVKFVVSGAGASAISCSKIYVSLGAKPENFAMLDSKGVIRKNRTNLDERKIIFATDRPIDTLEEAMVGADVFIGLSKGNILSAEMIQSMAADPIVFAMANPTPEIAYEKAIAARPDVIMATGRSDYPNQVNNVLGFPYIFRGALDVRATEINEAMKIAAVHALSALAKEPVPDMVNMAYNEKNLSFCKTYIIPKPVDPRLLMVVAPAVAKAAMESGVAKYPITNWEEYETTLAKRLGLDNSLTKVILSKAKSNPKKVVFADAENLKVLKAVQQVQDEGIAVPILLGNKNKIKEILTENSIDLGEVEIIDTRSEENKSRLENFGRIFYEKRKRKGVNLTEAALIMKNRNYFGAMLVETGEADALISGLTRNYPDTIRPALQVIGVNEGIKKVAGMYILLTKKGPIFFSDTTVNLNPTAEELVEIAELTAAQVRHFNIEPRIAMVSYSNFGSAKGDGPEKMQKATRLIQEKHKDWVIEGEMQAHLAFNTELTQEQYPFSKLAKEGANTLIFSNLSAANAAYNLLKEVGELEYIGPILLGIRKPVHVLQLGASVREIVNMVAMAVVEAQTK